MNARTLYNLAKAAAVAAAVSAATGCGTKVVIESDTSWTGIVDGRIVAGRGDASFDKDDTECSSFRKATRFGFLKAKIVRGGPLRPDGEEDITWDEYGVVTVCGR